jgi:hypothetical protein
MSKTNYTAQGIDASYNILPTYTQTQIGYTIYVTSNNTGGVPTDINLGTTGSYVPGLNIFVPCIGVWYARFSVYMTMTNVKALYCGITGGSSNPATVKDQRDFDLSRYGYNPGSIYQNYMSGSTVLNITSSGNIAVKIYAPAPNSGAVNGAYIGDCLFAITRIA